MSSYLDAKRIWLHNFTVMCVENDQFIFQSFSDSSFQKSLLNHAIYEASNQKWLST